MINKKGFTLIELLAVIVVLAIVTVVATQSILPYMANARPDAFAIEASNVIKSAQDAYSFYNINEVRLKNNESSCRVGNDICFTVKELIDLGIYEGDSDVFKGKVIIDITDSKDPEYTLFLSKGAEFRVTGSNEQNYVDNKMDIKDGGWTETETSEYTRCICEN